MMPTATRILAPELVARLGRFRLGGRRRVEGRFAGGHASRRFGSSVEFADHRAYIAGDDPRRVDWHAHARIGRLLVKLFEAEDEAALRVVVDASASMGFGAKLDRARQVAAALVAVAAVGGDRVRVLIAGDGVDPGPWYRGASALPAAELRLLRAGATGRADLPSALRRARAEGPRGPIVLVSDLLFDGWEDTVRVLGAGDADAALVHVLGRADVDPDLDGDLRLVDSETGQEREVGVSGDVRAAYAATVERWLDDVARRCGAAGVALARLHDDEPVEDLLALVLPRLGVIA
ncbi:MAG: DUF58 domain-containing protein [Euzebyales bacterium]|jgi:uncharacterized protein (DUF58 family)|nr:DUF58 domain-containing protein [Euzebyales bacterium]